MIPTLLTDVSAPMAKGQTNAAQSTETFDDLPFETTLIALSEDVAEPEVPDLPAWDVTLAPDAPPDVVVATQELQPEQDVATTSEERPEKTVLLDGEMPVPAQVVPSTDAQEPRVVTEAPQPTGSSDKVIPQPLRTEDVPPKKTAQPSVAQTVVEGQLPIAQSDAPSQTQMQGLIIQTSDGPPRPLTEESRALPRPLVEEGKTAAAPVRPDPRAMSQTEEFKDPARLSAGSYVTEDVKRVSKRDFSEAPPPAPVLDRGQQVLKAPAPQMPAPSIGAQIAAAPAILEQIEIATKAGDMDVPLPPGTVDRLGPSGHAAQTLVAAHATPETARHIAQQLAVAVSNPTGQATEIALYPEELGRVRMTMTAVEGSIVLNLSAERPETQDLLRRHIELLSQAFEDLGYTSIDFTFGEGHQQADTPEGADEHTPLAAELEENPSADVGVVTYVTTGVDLRI